MSGVVVLNLTMILKIDTNTWVLWVLVVKIIENQINLWRAMLGEQKQI